MAVAAALLRAPGLSADESLGRFHDLTLAAEGRQLALAHRFADTVGHKPRSFVGHAQQPMELVCAKALLAAGQQERSM